VDVKVKENDQINRLADQLGVDHRPDTSVEFWPYPFMEALANQLAALEVKVSDLEEQLKKREG
jgi:hypothetical protein